MNTLKYIYLRSDMKW